MITIKNILIDGKHQKPIVTDFFYVEDNQPKPVAIFCHGYKGFKDWGAWNLVAQQFADNRFLFVKFNFSHNGGTVENPIDFTDLEAFGNNNYTIELDDLEQVIKWVLNDKTIKNEIDKRKVFLIGHSRAGGIVVLNAAENNHIAKIVSWAGVANFADRFPKGNALKQWEKDGVYFVINSRTHQKIPHYFQYYQNFKSNEHKLTIKSAVEKLAIPHLIIHGNKDESVAVEEAHQLHCWNPKSELFLIDNANHTFGIAHPFLNDTLTKEMQAVVNRTIQFLQQ